MDWRPFALTFVWLPALLGQPTLRLDFGPANGPVWPGFELVTPGETYSKPTGYGFASRAGVHAYDRGEFLDDLRRDFVGGAAAAAFRVHLPPGRYRVFAILGDYNRTCYTSHVMSLSINGKQALQGFLEWFVPQTWVVDVRESLELALDGRWCLNALVVGPAVLLEMLYFRLLGRLAWVCDEDSRRELAEEDEEEEAENAEAIEIRSAPVDDF